MEHPPLLLDVLGKPVWDEPRGGVMYHDVWPLPALHSMDRCQGDPINVVWRVQLLRKPRRKPACVAFEIGQLAERVEIVTVSGDGTVAPLVERRRARVQPARPRRSGIAAQPGPRQSSRFQPPCGPA